MLDRIGGWMGRVPGWAWYALAALAAGIIFRLIRRKMQKNQQQKLNREQIEMRLREEELNRALANPANGGRPQYEGGTHPVNVQYNEVRQELEKSGRQSKMIRLTECAALSRKQYLLRREETVYIMSQAGSLSIQTQIIKNALLLCSIFQHADAMYVRRETESAQIRLSRKKAETQVTENSLKLETGDVLSLGRVKYEIELL